MFPLLPFSPFSPGRPCEFELDHYSNVFMQSKIRVRSFAYANEINAEQAQDHVDTYHVSMLVVATLNYIVLTQTCDGV